MPCNSGRCSKPAAAVIRALLGALGLSGPSAARTCRVAVSLQWVSLTTDFLQWQNCNGCKIRKNRPVWHRRIVA